jgi:heat shock protein HslJ
MTSTRVRADRVVGAGLGATALAVAVGMTGCGDDADKASNRSIWGRAFLSESVTEDSAPRLLVDGTRIRLSFGDDWQITASAGCNTLGGAVDITAERIDVGDLSTTDMGCDPALHAQDEWLADFLASDPGFTLDGDRLVLHDDGTSINFLDRRVADPDRPLEGTIWRLDGIIDGDAVSSVPADVHATLRFTDRQVTIDVRGCSNGMAIVDVDVDVDTTKLTVGQATMRGDECDPDEAVVEEAIVDALDGTVSYVIDAAGLVLTNRNGTGLTLRAQE